MRSVVLMAFFGVTCIAVSPANAVNNKWYAGASCHQINASSPSVKVALGDEPDGYIGTLTNQSKDKEAIVSCPIVKDDVRILNATVRVNDLTAKDEVACHLATQQPDGSIGEQVSAFTGIVKTDTNIELTFPKQKAFSGGGYFMRCKIPPMIEGSNPSGIINYRVEEQEG